MECTEIHCFPVLLPYVSDQSLRHSCFQPSFHLESYCLLFYHRMHLYSTEMIVPAPPCPDSDRLGYGEFSSDLNLYTDEVLNGFDYWLGTGRLLVAGAYSAGQTRKRVYFPKAGSKDNTPYIRVSADRKESYVAGTWAEIEVPLEEFAFFARAGTVLPIGRDIATVTAKTGLARTAVDGVEVKLIEQGGAVGLDDWRGIEIFPPTGDVVDLVWGSKLDRGRRSFPRSTTTVVSVEYRVQSEGVAVQAKFIKREFEVAWGRSLWVVLPAGDDRQVVGASETMDSNSRKAWEISVACALHRLPKEAREFRSVCQGSSRVSDRAIQSSRPVSTEILAQVK